MWSQSNRVPQVVGVGTAGANGKVPRVAAVEPAYIGNGAMSFSIVDGTPGKKAILIVSPTLVAGGSVFQGALLHVPTSGGTIVRIGPLADAGANTGWGRATLNLPSNPALVGQTRTAQWVVIDNVSATQRLAASNAVQYTIF